MRIFLLGVHGTPMDPSLLNLPSYRLETSKRQISTAQQSVD